MDAYHKVLVKLYEATGGKETAEVDFGELLKREGFFPSIDDITAYMSRESWITETRPQIVKITHWGVAEAKKAKSAAPDAANIAAKEANRLLTETREFIVALEDYIAKPDADKLKTVDKKFAEMTERFGKLKNQA